MKVPLFLTACWFAYNALAMSEELGVVSGDYSFENSLQTGILTTDEATIGTADPAPNTGACASRPCKNNAVCFYYGSTHYVCACKTGYTGRTCQYKACKKTFFFIHPYYKKCSNPYHVCVIEKHRPKCACFDPHVCR